MKIKFKRNKYFIVLAAISVIIYNKVVYYYLNTYRTSNIKYILQWTSPETIPFVGMGKGRHGFVNRKCPHTNCYVTSNRELLGDIEKFDVIAFHGPEVISLSENQLPKQRSLKQKYVFASIESSSNYPVCNNLLDGFFNWTWTYRLDSEVQWGYVVVRDISGTKIGPKTDAHWLRAEDMDPVPDTLKEQLKSKSKAVAWVASNCETINNREGVAAVLRYELNLYNLSIDMFGGCGSKCPNNDCWKTVKDDYYFYLSFENSNSRDYVTEKLLNAIHNYAIPVVYGGANYTRFMPDGMYLDAKQSTMSDLASEIHEVIQNPNKHYEYFKYRTHYFYHSTIQRPDTNEYCQMCALLNDDNAVKKTTIYKNFREYWIEKGDCG